MRYYKYINNLSKPYKHAQTLAAIEGIIKEDEFNNSYGRERMHSALLLKGINISLSTVYRVCRDNNILIPKNKPKGLTKADSVRNAAHFVARFSSRPHFLAAPK